MSEVVATASFLYNKKLYYKFEKINWIITGQRKQYVTWQLITLAFLVFPAFYFCLFYFLTRNSVYRKSYKILFKDYPEGVFQTFNFSKDSFLIRTKYGESEYKYDDFKMIVKTKKYVAMYSKIPGGFLLPINEIENYDEFMNVVGSLPIYIDLKKVKK